MSTRVRAFVQTPSGDMAYGGLCYRQIERAHGELVGAKLAPPLTTEELSFPRWKRARRMVKNMKGWHLRTWREPRKRDAKKSAFANHITSRLGTYPNTGRVPVPRSTGNIIDRARASMARVAETTRTTREPRWRPTVTQQRRSNIPPAPGIAPDPDPMPSLVGDAVQETSRWDFQSFIETVSPPTREPQNAPLRSWGATVEEFVDDEPEGESGF